MRHSARTSQRAGFRAKKQRRFPRSGIHKTNEDTAIGPQQHLRWHVASNQLVTRRQDHTVAFDPQPAIENDRVALAIIALGIFVRFDDKNPALPLWRNGAGKL